MQQVASSTQAWIVEGEINDVDVLTFEAPKELVDKKPLKLPSRLFSLDL
jgi:hypothetical protein